MPLPPAKPAISPNAQDLAKAFEDEFQVVVADTAELRDAAYALRHEVYCREFGFETVRADGLERDIYDERARHYLLAHVPSGAWAGCLRVVFADDADDEIGLPFEMARLPLLDETHLAATPRASIGEISRFTVAKDFRQGSRTRVPAVLGTALVGVAAVAESGLDSAVCMMKPQLKEQLRTYGIRFTQLTGIVEHRGQRALFQMVPRITCLEIRPDLQGILAAIRSRVARH